MAKHKHGFKTVKALRRMQNGEEDEEEDEDDASVADTKFVMRCGKCDFKWTPSWNRRNQEDADAEEDIETNDISVIEAEE